ncbi:hypothetical protein Plhal304r1_c035g0108531 [Plasmopara halstedii]
MSKRIMNQIMCLAEELDIKIYYQDTDSMHIDRHSIPKLSESFKSRYGRKLIGERLGQFHSDFEIKDENGKKMKNLGEIYATESYFISKKTYVDFLKCTESDIKSIHKRMKGISSKLINKPRETYDGLFNDNDQTFRWQKPVLFESTTRRNVSANSDRTFKGLLKHP